MAVTLGWSCGSTTIQERMVERLKTTKGEKKSFETKKSFGCPSSSSLKSQAWICD